MMANPNKSKDMLLEIAKGLLMAKNTRQMLAS